jgi:hypothetical protein
LYHLVMVLVCLSQEKGLYQVEDEDGAILLPAFYSARDPETVAKNIAPGVRVVFRASSEVPRHWPPPGTEGAAHGRSSARVMPERIRHQHPDRELRVGCLARSDVSHSS